MKQSTFVTPFKKPKSVFKDFKEDTEQTDRKCLENDRKYWKVDKLCKDNETKEAVMSIFKAQYSDLKEIFNASNIISGTPPDFHKREFFLFCKDAELVDENLHSGIIDTYFKATNFEEVDQENNDDLALNRFEFMEILLRIARGKYMEFSDETQLAYAMMKLLQTNILPMKAKLPPLQSWRNEQLWCIEVSDLLEVNIRAIKKLYAHIAVSMFNKVKNRIEDLSRSLVSIDKICTTLKPVLNPIHISERKIMKAFYMSKMTVINENDDANYEYTYLHLPEFLEFIGRLAWLKYLKTYQNDTWPLIKKMKVVMRALFKLIQEPVIEPPEMEQNVSDSDDDY